MNLPSVPNQPGANQLSTEVRKQQVTKAVEQLVETGIIVPEQAKALTTAVSNLGAMKVIAPDMQRRHFAKLTTTLSVRSSTPVTEARMCLESMQAAWSGVEDSFHEFRTGFLATKVRRAKLTKRCKEVTELPEGDDKIIGMAECELEEAEIQKVEATLARKSADIKAQVEKATRSSDQYKLICTQAGKGEAGFTDADFRQEEADYYLKAAFWHATKVHADVPTYERDSRRPTITHMATMLPEEMTMLFQVLGITSEEVVAALDDLKNQRAGFNLTHSAHHSFQGHFDGWLARTVQKFAPRVSAAMSANPEKVKRVQELLNPDEGDGGSDGWKSKSIKRGTLHQ